MCSKTLKKYKKDRFKRDAERKEKQNQRYKSLKQTFGYWGKIGNIFKKHDAKLKEMTERLTLNK